MFRSVTEHRQIDDTPGRRLAHQPPKPRDALDALAVPGHDDVALFDAGLGRRFAVDDAVDVDAVRARHPELRGALPVHIQDLHTEVCATPGKGHPDPFAPLVLIFLLGRGRRQTRVQPGDQRQRKPGGE